MKSSEFLTKAREIAIKIAKKQGQVTADDVRAKLEIPSKIGVNVMGSVFVSKLFKDVGYTRSKRKEARGRLIKVYKLN